MSERDVLISSWLSYGKNIWRPKRWIVYVMTDPMVTVGVGIEISDFMLH